MAAETTEDIQPATEAVAPAAAPAAKTAPEKRRETKLAAEMVTLRLVRSPLGRLPVHRRTVEALGLRKVGQTVEKRVDAALLGMIRQVEYLLHVTGPTLAPTKSASKTATATRETGE